MTSAAKKHRLTQTRILSALENAELVQTLGDKELYVGTDDRGVELEIILVPDDTDSDRMACIHAMPTHYRTNHREEQ